MLMSYATVDVLGCGQSTPDLLRNVLKLINPSFATFQVYTSYHTAERSL